MKHARRGDGGRINVLRLTEYSGVSELLQGPTLLSPRPGQTAPRLNHLIGDVMNSKIF